MTPQVEKQQFRNQTNGWIGAVVINAKGEDSGVAVEPQGTVWLSEAEQRLTANAPRDPRDNPFIEQTALRRNPDTDALEEYQITPLVPISENRYVPADERFFPAADMESSAGATAVSQAAATAAEPTTPTVIDGGALQREAEVQSMGADVKPHQPLPPTPAKAAAAAAAMGFPPGAQVGAQEAATPTQPEVQAGSLGGTDIEPEQTQEPTPEPTGDVQPGSLGGTDAPQPEGEQEAAPAPEQPAPPVAEEQAAQVDPSIGEETGAAAQPAGPAPEGEYAAHEEVGTPVEETGAQKPEEQADAPQPWTPPNAE